MTRLNGPGHRLFFALQPEDQTLAGITSVQRLIESAEGRATAVDRIHVTLLFLGQQNTQDLTRLREIASGLDFPACSLTLDRIGYFPRARVAWLGPSVVPAELMSFQACLSREVDAAGIRFDQRPWQMHVTLYRDLRKAPGKIGFEPVEWCVDRFHLLESVHDRNGLRYCGRGRWPS